MHQTLKTYRSPRHISSSVTYKESAISWFTLIYFYSLLFSGTYKGDCVGYFYRPNRFFSLPRQEVQWNGDLVHIYIQMGLMRPFSNFKVSIVLPCLNEAGNVSVILTSLKKELTRYADYEIIFVDDGSSDNTLEELKSLESEHVKFISFTRNFGAQYAIKAGLDHSTGDCTIIMDADSEHPTEIIHKLIERWLEGYELVTTTRKENRNLPFLKRMTSKLYYRFLKTLSDVDVSEGSSDFRLIDRKIVDVVKDFKEIHLFWRGLFQWIGCKQAYVGFEQNIRKIGTSSYNYKKMILLAIDGVTSFSTKPLYISIVIGFIFASFAFIYGIYAIYMRAFTDIPVSGWTSILAGMMFIGGLQLIIMGIIGIYLGRLFFQSKSRPTYLISESSFKESPSIYKSQKAS